MRENTTEEIARGSRARRERAGTTEGPPREPRVTRRWPGGVSKDETTSKRIPGLGQREETADT